jgi:Hydrazine synthase alpha subunit middle domain/WD40-like Beta Propeller Repeat
MSAWSNRVIYMFERRCLPLVLLTVALAGCGSTGDGSVGIGSGQSPDPVAPDFAIAYTKGPLFDKNNKVQQRADLRDPRRFNVGTDLFVRDRASPSAAERNVTLRQTTGTGDVMGVQISQDGKKVLFAMRGPFDPTKNMDNQPTWAIWEYEIATDTLHRLIAADITAAAGNDVSPYYLPDGRIIFSSTRQRQAKAILLDEGKPQFDAQDEDRRQTTYVLHVMDADGSNLHQVSFNQSDDFGPTVLDSGRILFSRWNHAGGVNGIDLYTMNPDGSDLQLLYGRHSHLTGTNNGEVEFIGAHEMMDGKIMAILRPFTQPDFGGAIAIIDTPHFVENNQALTTSAGMAGPAQVDATPLEVRTDAVPSKGGRFSSAFPLWDGTGRVLASWSICRLAEPDPNDVTKTVFVPCTDAKLADPMAVAAPPLYGIWMYDPVTQTQQPVVTGEEGVLIGDIVAAQPRKPSANIPDKVAGVDVDADLVAEGVGILNIRSAYDLDGTASANIGAVADPLLTTAAQRPARFLRVEKAVAIPDDKLVDLNNTAFGPDQSQGMREIVAYAPIEPDGSVRVKVPANVPLAVSILDANGRRITPRHQNWLQVIPGQELKCNGCHASTTNFSHGRSDTFAAAYAGAVGTGVPFPNTRSTYSPDVGETMAETRTRVEKQIADKDLVSQLVCPPKRSIDPSVNLVYCDAWTNPAVRTPDASFAYDYAALKTTAPVTDTNCIANWSASCRIVISYEAIIHPLWGLQRQVLDPMTQAVLADHTCNQGGCHAPTNAMAMAAVPGGQLDLSDGPSADEPTQFNSYRELLFGDNAQVLVNGALQDQQVQIGTDAMGNPIFAPVAVGASMSSAGARASNRFFAKFDAGGSHAGWMTTAELRLVAEWLDIGAQYCNNPFATTGCPLN